MQPGYSYSTSIRETDNRRRRFTFWDMLVLVISLVAATALLLSYLARAVNPNSGWIFSIFGLASPVLYIINVVLALYWVLRWRFWVLVPGVVLLVGIGSLSLFFHPSLKKHYNGQEDQHKSVMRVMTYNVEGFLSHLPENRTIIRMDSTGTFIRDLNPDILCIQEYQITEKLPAARIEELLEALPHRFKNFVLGKRIGEDYGWGLALYSRYPILRQQAILFEGTTNSAMWADLLIAPADTVRVFNCHLQTTALTQSDRMFMTPEEFVQADNDVKRRRVKNIGRKLRDNYKIRAHQADTMSVLIAESPYPVIVCGDFNDTPMSYAYRRVKGDLTDSFVEKGRGASSTYKGFFNMFRIDYVFHSPGFEAVNYDSPEEGWSDHNPVVVDMRRKQ